MPLAIVALHGNDGFSANALHLSAAQALVTRLLDPLQIGGNHLEFEAGTSRVEDENVHILSVLLGSAPGHFHQSFVSPERFAPFAGRLGTQLRIRPELVKHPSLAAVPQADLQNLP